MAISILQTPPIVSLAQSPIIFSVSEASQSLLQENEFQYIADLYYWTGSLTASSSLANYQMAKFPNLSLAGIFDLNRILNSTLIDLAQVNTSNVIYYAVDFYPQYFSGSQFVTGSHTKSDTYQALDGYAIFQEPIGQEINLKTPYWALMTDGPATQSVLLENTGRIGLYTGINNSTCLGATITATTADFPGGNTQTLSFTFIGSLSSSTLIRDIPCAPSEPDFFAGLAPFIKDTIFTYSIQAITLGGAPVGEPIRFNIVCNQKYPNVRIKWKNRYGQFDWFNFNMVNRQSFNTERRTYQPQLGSWQSPTLAYNNYDSSVLNYIADSKQAISVNTDWVDEAYNEIFKQLLVSDEIYWIYDEANGDLRPITIATDSITFKTGVNDKVIQYAFDFNWGQAYKLII